MPRHAAETKQRALKMSDQGLTNGQISRELGISRRTVYDWAKCCSTAPYDRYTAPVAIPEHVKADRDYRLSLVPESIVAALMGDPPPCRSALGQGASS